MQVTEITSEGLKRSYKIVISASDIDQKIDGRLTELSGRVNVPGFRPGKAPLSLLKQRFGTSVRGEVIEKAINDASESAINERGLRPAAQPRVQLLNQEEGQDLEYSMDLEILPDIEPMDFSKLKLERLKVKVADHEVEDALAVLAKQNRTPQALAEPRPAAIGDVVVLDFNGTVDGEALPGMAGEDHHLELGSNQFIPGFEEKLAGVEAGESLDVAVTFPADYGNEELAGREAQFACTIKEIMEQAAPEIDEAFAQSLGVDDLETLRGRIRDDIGREYERLSRERMKREMLDMLAEAHDFSIPPSMESAEFDAIWKQIEADRERGVVDPEDEGKDDEALREEYRGIAVRRVRLGLLLAEVGRVNEVEVQQDEVNAAIYREASRFPGQEQQMFQFYQNNPQALAQLRAPIFEDKVVDFIAELAEVAEREVSADDLRAEEEATQEKQQKPAKKSAKKKTAPKKTAKKAESGKAAGKAPKKTSKSKKADEAAAEES